MHFWNYFHHPRAAMVLLRITLAVLMLFHGWSKIAHGVAGIEAILLKAGWPSLLAYGVLVGEVLAPLLLLVGLWVVPAALTVAASMLVAVALVHTGHFLRLSPSGGWALELQAFFLITAVVVALGHCAKK